jgi:hypothetical protein
MKHKDRLKQSKLLRKLKKKQAKRQNEQRFRHDYPEFKQLRSD